MRADVEIEAPRPLAQGLVADLARSLRQVADGGLVAFVTGEAGVGPELEKWASLTGHVLVERAEAPGGTRFVVRKGRAATREDDVGLEERLWLYLNLDCNLACDYCCVRSSPTAPRAALGVERAAALAEEAAALGVRRLFLTGGEPFLLPDLDRVVAACAARLPVTLLTNAMLLKGRGRAALEGWPRERVTLQVSLDSPTPHRHDAHRGPGSWARARAGIKTARAMGYRVRVAATTASDAERREMDAFLATLGVPPEDRVVRPLARRGHSKEGLALARQDLRPELTVTVRGYYWHPVGATDDDFLLTREPVPLAQAFDLARARMAEDARHRTRAQEVFRCA